MRAVPFTCVALASLVLSCGWRAAAAESPTKLDPVLVAAPPVPLVLLKMEPKLLVARFAAAAVSDGPYIYIIGGSNSHDTRLDDVERFDTRTGQSEKFTRLKYARRNHRAVVADGKIYVIGGLSDVDHPTEQPFLASMEVIDLATRAVTDGPPVPERRANFACVKLGGKIYVIGGARSHRGKITNTNTTFVYDLAARRWDQGVPMPTPRMAVAAAIDGGFIVVPGGYSGRRTVDNVEAFNPQTQEWLILPKLHQPVHANSLSFLGHHLFLFGNQEMVAYDLVPKRSASYRFDYRAVQDTAAVINGGRIYVIGGSASTEPIAMEDYFYTGPDPVGRFAKVFTERGALYDIQMFELKHALR